VLSLLLLFLDLGVHLFELVEQIFLGLCLLIELLELSLALGLLLFSERVSLGQQLSLPFSDLGLAWFSLLGWALGELVLHCLALLSK